MECFWRLHSHRLKVGDRYQQNPAVFHVYVYTYDGLPDHHLHGIGFLEKYAEVYLGGEAESLVLLVNSES